MISATKIEPVPERRKPTPEGTTSLVGGSREVKIEGGK